MQVPECLVPRDKDAVRKLIPAGRLQLRCPQELWSLEPWGVCQGVSPWGFSHQVGPGSFCQQVSLLAWHKPVGVILLSFNPAGNAGGCALESPPLGITIPRVLWTAVGGGWNGKQGEGGSQRTSLRCGHLLWDSGKTPHPLVGNSLCEIGGRN